MDDEGLKLLKEFVEKHPYADGAPLSYCFYCESAEEYDEPHAHHCPWRRARAYLRDQGVEVKDDGA